MSLFSNLRSVTDNPFHWMHRGCPGKDICNLYDWTCLCQSTKFRKRWQELGESPFEHRPSEPLRPLNTSLPLYVPMIRHGSSREDVFQSPIVALSTFDVLKLHNRRGYGPRFSTPEELRIRFRLRPDAQILLVSVAKDKRLEAYWSHRNEYKVPEALFGLAPLGITTPNYSSFIDAPSSHTTWNLRRMRRVAEELSRAGIAVVPHLNARTSADWRFWGLLLEEQPSIRFVCKEFQTGLHKCEVGARTLGRMAELQDRLRRKLHPLLVGGARFSHVAARYFEHFTIIDSVPFIRTVNRMRCSDRSDDISPHWVKHSLARHIRLDDLLEYNYKTYNSILAQRTSMSHRVLASESQMNLPLGVSLH